MNAQNTPVVILAGGLGMRMRDYSEHLPKALVPIGDMAVIHHVMKIYAHQGFKRFILCVGYKGEMIKEYFSNLHLKTGNIRLSTANKNVQVLDEKTDDFDITFVNTGIDTPTGGRIKKIEKYIDTENFFATYCDGLADIDLNELLNFHISKGKTATLTAIHPMSPFGILEIENGIVSSFKEKPMLPGNINGGFFVFNKKIFNDLNEDSVLEEAPLRKLVETNQLAAFQHGGFWSCMDTFKDVDRLKKLWHTGFLPHMGY